MIFLFFYTGKSDNVKPSLFFTGFSLITEPKDERIFWGLTVLGVGTGLKYKGLSLIFAKYYI